MGSGGKEATQIWQPGLVRWPRQTAWVPAIFLGKQFIDHFQLSDEHPLMGYTGF